MEHARVSLADVAAAAGVGKATASRALSERPERDIGPATRERVRAAAAALGYRPNRAAQALRTGQVRAFALVTPIQDWAWWAPVVQGAATEAAARGYQLLVIPIEHTTRVEVILDHLRSHALDGAVIMTDDVLDTSVPPEAQLPVVLIDDITPAPTLPTVRTANHAGGEELARHLISRGRTRPLVVLTEPRFHYIEQRLAGFRSAYREAGIEIGEDRVVVSQEVFGSTGDQPADLLDSLDARRGSFDAVFAIADYVAATVIRALRHHGVTIPDDVAVVGYDDERVAFLLDPPLTTMRQPLHQMGAAAIQALTTIVGGGELEHLVQELPGQLIIRASA